MGNRQSLTIDEAVAAFSQLMQRMPLPEDCGAPAAPRTAQDKDAACQRFAEHLLALACPDPAACQVVRCQRQGQCRHVSGMRHAHATAHPARPPGATAVRYAMWAFMTSNRVHANAGFGDGGVPAQKKKRARRGAPWNGGDCG